MTGSQAVGTLQEVFTQPPAVRCFPVLVDANTVIKEVLRRSRGSFTALGFLAQNRWIALLAPTQIAHEVDEHLARVASATRADAEAAECAWADYRRLIRFVDVPIDDVDDRRVSAVACRDPDDVYLAALAVMLAPALVVTEDKDLTDAGFGNPELAWLQDVLLLHRLTMIDVSLWGGLQLAVITGRLVATGVAGSARTLARSELALGVIIGAAAFALLELRPQLRAAGGRTRTTLTHGARRTFDEITRLLEQRAHDWSAFAPRLVECGADQPALAAVSRLLAAHSAPLDADAVHRELTTAGYDLSPDETLELLQTYAMFAPTTGGWCLGRCL